MKYQDVIKLRLPPGNFSACFAFSVHKCGSSLMHKMINDVCKSASLPCLNIPEPMFNNGIQGWDKDEAILDYIKDGYIYFGFRMLPPVFQDNFDFSRSRNVLLVRDPRDALGAGPDLRDVGRGRQRPAGPGVRALLVRAAARSLPRGPR